MSRRFKSTRIDSNALELGAERLCGEDVAAKVEKKKKKAARRRRGKGGDSDGGSGSDDDDDDSDSEEEEEARRSVQRAVCSHKRVVAPT